MKKENIIKGKVYVLKDNIDTDQIIPAIYLNLVPTIPEEYIKLGSYALSGLPEDFTPFIAKGETTSDFTIIVAGTNFGMGSSREQAPLAIKAAGIVAVVAQSFARIFYRNGFNIGLPLIEAETGTIGEADFLEIDIENGILRNTTTKKTLKINPLPSIMQTLLVDGGIINHFQKHKGIKL